MFGLLNVNKPVGVTSRDVVNIVQGLVYPAKCGHAGTLDPLARGVLVICVGPATRLIEYLHRMPKRYRGSFILGCRSDTEDIMGTLVRLHDPPCPTRDEVEATLPRFVGSVKQRPPIYSAKKVRGRRAYKLARSGKRPRLAEREIEIFSVALVSYEYPDFQIDVTCGSGTYIRSLGRDIGQSLRTAAVMSQLVRTAIGPFGIDDAVDPMTLTRRNVGDSLIPAVEAVAALPKVTLTAEEERKIAQGMAITREDIPAAEEFAALADDGRLAAILAPRSNMTLGPTRYFPPSAT
jgi:tRNA pseudouridine55 synthase